MSELTWGDELGIKTEASTELRDLRFADGSTSPELLARLFARTSHRDQHGLGYLRSEPFRAVDARALI
jgi:hypothetical protein